MAKKNNGLDLSESSIDLSMDESVTPALMDTYSQKHTVADSTEKEEIISCLRNEIVSVRYIKKQNGFITNPKHALFGGMAETATRTFTVPMNRSGSLVNVLTNSEKAFLEKYLNLDNNALSIYNKTNNYWRNYKVVLTKSDTYLNLSIPEDYIKYKVLLSNKNLICKDLNTLSESPKVTYQFVIVSEYDETKQSSEQMTTSLEAAMLLGKIQEDKSTLRHVVQILSGKRVEKKSKLEFLQGMAFKEMQANPKLFISVVKDPFMKTKMLIDEAVEYNLLRKAGDFIYDKTNNTPLCEDNEEPTLQAAARYLNNPRRQEMKLMLEAKLKSLKD